VSEVEPSKIASTDPSVERAVRTVVRLARLFKRADAGLGLAQFRTLELVSRGTERSSQLASRLATSKPAVTVVVDGLVAAGLLTRSSLAGDRRVIRLALTDDGREALARAERAYCERLEPLLDEVSDRATLLALLAELDDVMDARSSRHPATPASPTQASPTQASPTQASPTQASPTQASTTTQTGTAPTPEVSHPR
jgi:DNA-binding MarR family transcriptional regulator